MLKGFELELYQMQLLTTSIRFDLIWLRLQRTVRPRPGTMANTHKNGNVHRSGNLAYVALGMLDLEDRRMELHELGALFEPIHIFNKEHGVSIPYVLSLEHGVSIPYCRPWNMSGA